MQSFPPTPSVDEAPPGLFDRGHLWFQEWVVGAPLRFRVTDAGIEFGDREATFEPWDEPMGYRFAARHVRESFDERAFRDAVDAPADYTFFGVATRNEGVAYDWDRLPPFLGCEVHAADEGFRPPDVAERVFDRLGLAALNAFEKEVAASHFQPDRYAIPDSAWYDGPAAGVLVRNKRGQRAVVHNPDVEVAPAGSLGAADLVDREVTPDRIDRVAEAVGGPDASVEAVLDRLVETLLRRHHHELADGVGGDAVRDAAVVRVARRVG